jgi:transcriptional regulator with XRE-family HTH domain
MQTQEGQVKRGRQARNTGASQLANQHIGERIRLRRTLLGLSQSGLGKALGLSFQQMQKYERGTSSIGAGQLCEVARALDVPVSFFYDGLDGVSIPTNSDAGERRDRFADDELEVLGHYRTAPGFIREAIRSLLGYLSNQDPRHDRDAAGGAAVKQEVPAAGSPPVNGTGQTPSRDDGGPHHMMEGTPGVGAGTDPNRQDVGELSESVPPESGQARSEPQEQRVPTRRPRGRPRKVVDTAQAEPDPPRQGSSDAGKRTSGATSAGRPKRAKSGMPADGKAAEGRTFNRAEQSPASGKPNRKNPRRTYGATWSPSDIGK